MQLIRVTGLGPDVRSLQCADLLLTVIILCCGQPVLSHVGRLLTGDADEGLERRRAAVLRTVRLLSEDVSRRYGVIAQDS